MKLSDYVAEVTTEIVMGVRKAKKSLKNYASIAPGIVDGVPYNKEQEIVFEITISVTEETSKDNAGKISTKASINVVGISAGISSDAGRDNFEKSSLSHIQRVSFIVPVLLNKHHRDDPHFDAEMAD